MQHLLYEPGDPGECRNGKHPLLLFLHGGGEGGNDIEQVKRFGPPRLIEDGRRFPFYLLAPQNPRTTGFWPVDTVADLLDETVANHPIDETRILLAGMSRGGFAAWCLAMNQPDRFAALLAVCAACSPRVYARWITKLPVWIIHGTADRTVPVSESLQMIEALKSYGNEPRVTIVDGAGHDVWTQAFNNDATYAWLLGHHT